MKDIRKQSLKHIGLKEAVVDFVANATIHLSCVPEMRGFCPFVPATQEEMDTC